MIKQNNFLEIDESLIESSLLINREHNDNLVIPPEGTISWQPKNLSVIPIPGFCVKTKDKRGIKLFLNICQDQHIPEPKEISEVDLAKLLIEYEQPPFRIPMSVGEPYTEKDNCGVLCRVHDIIVNPKFFKKINESEIFTSFLVAASFQAIEEKYGSGPEEGTEWVKLKNRKYMGSPREQHIQNRLIQELDAPIMLKPLSANTKKSLIVEVDEKKSEIKNRLQYQILCFPADGEPEKLLIDVFLPNINSAKGVKLEMNSDRLFLQANEETLDLFLPFVVDAKRCNACLILSKKMLHLTVPIISPHSFS